MTKAIELTSSKGKPSTNNDSLDRLKKKIKAYMDTLKKTIPHHDDRYNSQIKESYPTTSLKCFFLNKLLTIVSTPAFTRDDLTAALEEFKIEKTTTYYSEPGTLHTHTRQYNAVLSGFFISITKDLYQEARGLAATPHHSQSS